MFSPIENTVKLNLVELARRQSFLTERGSIRDNSNKLEAIPEACFLSRKDILASDRSRKGKTLMRRGKDVSYLYDCISPEPMLPPTYDSSNYPLPLEISELTLLLKSDAYSTAGLFARTQYSRPFGRKDAVNLAVWLEEMHSKYLTKLDFLMKTKDIVELELAEVVESIYLIALKESIKQIAVSCIERAEMINNIFGILNYTWKKSPDDLKRKIDSIKARHHQDMQKLKSKYKQKQQSLKKKYADLEQRLEEFTKERDLLHNETAILKRHITKINADFEGQKAEYKPKYIRKSTAETGTQTDAIEESESSEESSSEEEEDKEVEAVQLNRMITKQLTMTSEKKHDNLAHLKKHLDAAQCSGVINIDELYQYICTEYCDFFAWVDGFRLASELKNPEKQILESKSKNGDSPGLEGLNSENQKMAIIEEEEEGKKPYKNPMTLIHKFKPNETMAQHISENSPVEHILAHISELTPKRLAKAATISARKLVNNVNAYVLNTKAKSIDQYQSWAIYVYSCLFQKYSLKPIANRKFKEFVASCLKNAEEYNVQVFLRMLGNWPGLRLSNFWLCTSKMCLKVYDFMQTDKTGILMDGAPADLVQYPTVRAIECIKQLFEPVFVRSDSVRLRKKLENLIIIDPSEMNRFGLIDIHRFVLLAAEAYQDYAEKVAKGVVAAAGVLTDFKYITWEEANILIRNLNPKKELKLADKSAIEMNQTDEIELDIFQEFCIERGVLRTEDFNRFFAKDPVSHEDVVEKIREMKERLPRILEKCEETVITYSFDEWDGKLDDIVIGLRSKSPEKANRQWVMIWTEYQRLLNKIKAP